MRQQARVDRSRLDGQARSVTPSCPGTEPLALGASRKAHLLWRQHGLDPHRLHLAVMQAITAPVNFIHPCVDGRSNLLGAPLTVRPLGYGGQRRNGQHRPLQRKGQALYHTHSNAHASEGAGSATERQGIDRRQGNACLPQQRTNHGKQALSM